MIRGRILIAGAALAVGLSAPVMANPIAAEISTAIPEPSDFALFLMGVAGLVIGRRSARRRHPDDNDTNA